MRRADSLPRRVEAGHGTVRAGEVDTLWGYTMSRWDYLLFGFVFGAMATMIVSLTMAVRDLR